ncbi:unnamed protein product [Linum trigynum]|uniref:Uncharacterized protein n=1 Tax=Linum trigynum TaxID=586398 RepID=A0AAV2CI06_9ROSI
MLRLEVSWDRRKQSGQVDFNAGFTAPPAHLAILCLASAVSGLAAALLAGRRLLWAVELTILSDVGNMLALSALLPILTKKVKESKLSLTSTAESYKVSLVAPDVAWQSVALLSAMTLGAAWNAAIVYGASSSLALLHSVASLRSFVAMVRLGLPQSVADSKASNLVSCLVGLHLTQMIGENFLGTAVVEHDEEDACGETESSITEQSSAKYLTEDKMMRSRIGDEEETDRGEVGDHGEKNGTATGGSTTEDGDAQLDGWDWEHIMEGL